MQDISFIKVNSFSKELGPYGYLTVDAVLNFLFIHD